MTDYTALRKALADGPTPGPWIDHDGNEVRPMLEFDDGFLEVDALDRVCITQCRNMPGLENAAFIAAADPSTIVALLAERDALLVKNIALEAKLELASIAIANLEAEKNPKTYTTGGSWATRALGGTP